MNTEITNTYLIYFEIFGKKMKTRVQENSKKEVRCLIMGKLIFHKVATHIPYMISLYTNAE